MRGFLILVVVVLLMALIGWISFDQNSDRSSINIETDKIQDDTTTVIERGEDLIEGGSEAIDPDAEPTDDVRNDEIIREPADRNALGEDDVSSAPPAEDRQ